MDTKPPKIITLEIPGKPVAKARARVARWGTYTPEKTVNYETLIQELFAISKQPKLEGQLIMSVKAFFPIPKSASKAKKTLMQNGKVRPITKPDFDNLGKIVADALKGMAYHDDSQIVTGIVRKYYADQPRMEILIYEDGWGE